MKMLASDMLADEQQLAFGWKAPAPAAVSASLLPNAGMSSRLCHRCACPSASGALGARAANLSGSDVSKPSRR
jgi:hypothetical protein